MDRIFIEQLRIDTVIGVYDWERQIEQTLLLDLELSFDLKPAAVSEDLGDTLDYFAVSEDITAFVRQKQFQLVETLAEQVCQRLNSEYGVKQVRIRVHKPGAVQQARSVGVEIFREYPDT